MDAQKALLATDAPGGLDVLNDHLARGWRVAAAAPMGGGGQTDGFAALVVIERTGRGADAVLDDIAEEVEAVIETGDGASEDLPIENAIERLSGSDTGEVDG